jgi:EAL domain-containing protein (putative c-di-GMP-specific phosphodiesterase class I)
MSFFDAPAPIETDGHVLRARRTAAVTRIVAGIIGIAMILTQPHLLPHPAFGIAGFVIVGLTAFVQLAALGPTWLRIEESLSPAAGVLIIGLGSEHVTVITLVWLVALASGVLARGGRVHWFGRDIVLLALALPIIRYGSLSGEYAALLVASMGLLLTSGRLTTELNLLLRAARLQAESAETLLLAGDIASRVADRDDHIAAGRLLAAQHLRESQGAEQRAGDQETLERLITGEGIAMVVQPIVDLADDSIHGYEALARFDDGRLGGSPLHWFSVAEELGERPALERACLRRALELFDERPQGTSMSLNLSAPVLLDPLTTAALEHTRSSGKSGLEGLIIEVTEETLVSAGSELQLAVAPLLARGAQLAVDDMGAGYSGLRQITSVRPAYLKLDRSLIAGIDTDDERAALVGALAGYAKQVGSLLVAEGVETEAELATVRRLGVPLVQGFYFSRPRPPWPELDPGRSTSPAAAIPGDELSARRARVGVLEPVA